MGNGASMKKRDSFGPAFELGDLLKDATRYEPGTLRSIVWAVIWVGFAWWMMRHGFVDGIRMVMNNG
jgi:hypothetical protein